MAKGNKHVTPRSDGTWAVKTAGASRASSTHDRQSEAIKTARKAAKKDGVELVIHGKDGRIREKDSHGNDPFPPRG